MVVQVGGECVINMWHCICGFNFFLFGNKLLFVHNRCVVVIRY